MPAADARRRVNEEGAATRGWRVAARRLFFNTAITVVGLIRNTRAVSRTPLPLRAIVNDLAADLRHPAPILILEEKDPPGALPILTLIALRAGGLLARLDDLCAVTVGALYRNGNHRLPPRADCVYSKHTGKLPICNITFRMSEDIAKRTLLRATSGAGPQVTTA